MQLEERIDTLPFNLYRKIKYTCYCGAIHEKNYRYELTIKLNRTYGLNRKGRTKYYVFYECSAIPLGDSRKYIGRHGGLGHNTLEDAIKELEGYVRRELEDKKS